MFSTTEKEQIVEIHSHYNDAIMSAMASQITSLTIVDSTVYSGADQRKHQSSASLAFVRGIYWWPGNSPHKGPVTRKMFPLDDVIMFRRQEPVDAKWQYVFYWIFKLFKVVFIDDNTSTIQIIPLVFIRFQLIN